jgi:hypothetical protein
MRICADPYPLRFPGSWSSVFLSVYLPKSQFHQVQTRSILELDIQPVLQVTQVEDHRTETMFVQLTKLQWALALQSMEAILGSEFIVDP